MSSDNCYLCASDEGMLLDIFAGGGKAHCAKIETCLSVKIEKRNATSTKICHKCAYELDACSKFVQKYRETSDVREVKGKRPKGHCTLCLEPGKKGYIFELGEGTPLNNSLRKIRAIFNDNFFKDQPSKLSICLNCRYNLDVLFDLKSVYQTTLDKLKDTEIKEKGGTKTSAYTRTKTSVVSRKTTYIALPELNGDIAYESDSTVISAMPMRRKRGRPRKDSSSSMSFRNCEQCDTAVESGIDMYRYHRTGRTVCKDCWLKMDPEKVTNNKRRKLGLVLKDVLLNPSKYTSMYKVERDEKGNTTFLITDDSSENEEKDTPLKRTPRSGQGLVKSVREEAAVPDKKKPVKRVASGKSSNREDEPPAKVAVKEKTKPEAERNGAFTSDSEMMVLRTKRNLVGSSKKNAKHASLSDVEVRTQASKKKVGRPRKDSTPSRVSPPKTMVTRTRRWSLRAASTVETLVDKSVDKPIDKSTDKPVNSSTDKPVDKSVDKPVDKSVDKPVDKSVDKPVDKSVDKPVNKSVDKVERPVRRTRANSFTSQDSTSLARRLTGSSLSKAMRPKTKSMSPTSSASEAEPETVFTCGVCKAQYKNKLMGMAHELTHSKQPEVKLQRVAIPEIIIEEAPAEPKLIEEPEEQSHDVSSTSENGAENAESGETPVAEAPMETETETNVDAKDETKGKADDDGEKASVQIDEPKDTKTTDDDSVGIIEKCENEGETNAPEDREPETNDEDKKADEVSANQSVDVDNSITDENKVDEVTEERPAEDKTIIERSIQETTENSDSVDKFAVEEREEDNKGDKDVEVKDQQERHKEEQDEEKKDEENRKEEMDKEEHKEEKNSDDKDSEDKNIEEKDNGRKNVEETNIEEKDCERINIEEKNSAEKDSERKNIEEKDSERKNIEEKDSERKNIEEKNSAEKDSEEKDKEESTNNSTEEPVRANGVDAVHESESKIDRAEKEEAARSDAETNGRIVESRAPQEASEIPENENEGGSAGGAEAIASTEGADESLESTLESAPTEAATGEDIIVRKESESISVVTEVLREVFDLATAEVQKRLETERPNNEKCSTPIPETLENISREIQNSADMPSLEPLVEDRSGNDRS